MSHFTTIKTVIREQVILAEALRNLHYRFQEGEQVLIRGYQNNTAYGQVVVDTGCKYDIGFQKQADDTFSVCTDWWGVQGNSQVKQDDFLRQVNRTYSHLAVRQQVVQQGYLIEEEKILANGEIEIVVCEPV